MEYQHQSTHPHMDSTSKVSCAKSASFASCASRIKRCPFRSRAVAKTSSPSQRRRTFPARLMTKPAFLKAKTGRIHLDLAWKKMKLEGVFGFFLGGGWKVESKENWKYSIRNSFKIFKRIISSFGFQSFWEWKMNKIKHRDPCHRDDANVD